MKIEWVVRPGRGGGHGARCFSTFEAAWACEGDFVSQSRSGLMFRVEVEGRVFYVKKYELSKRRWKRWLGQSKARTEWRNYLWFESVGIPTARLVAYGRERRGWMTGRGIVATEELPGTMELLRVAMELPHLLRNREWLAEVSRQVARATRIMHDHGFAHNDLKWRNILVETGSRSPRVFFIDCPAGMKWYPPFLEYRIVKDLACLDKRAKYELSRTQRLAFYKEYAQCAKLTPRDKRRIRRILAFFQGRE